MNGPPPPVRGPDCPPAIALEELAAAGAPLPPHVDGCEACKGYVAALKVELSQYRDARPFEQLEGKLARRAAEPAPKRSLRWLFAVLPLAAAVAVLLVLLGRQPPVESGIRDMGGPFTVTAQRAGTHAVEPLHDDSNVSLGDRLGFSFNAPKNGQLLVFELDGREQVSTVFSGEGGASAAVTAGAMVLPKSWELTEPAAPEWFIAVFSTRPLDAVALAAQLKGQSTRARLELRCDDCSFFTLRLTTSKD